MKPKLGMLFLGLILITPACYTVKSNTCYADAVQTTIQTETIDDWMPDKGLQTQISQDLGIPIEQLTKETLADKTVYLDIDFTDIYFPMIQDLTGVEYLKGYSVVLSPRKNITTTNLETIFTQHLDNLESVNWYGNDVAYSQIDFYSVFKDWKYFYKSNVPEENSTFDISGNIAHESKIPLVLDPASYSEGGEIKLSLKDLGIWSSDTVKFYSGRDVFQSYGLSDALVIKEGGRILATYDFSTFDPLTQSFIFKFNPQKSLTLEELQGKHITYVLTTPQVDRYSDYSTFFDTHTAGGFTGDTTLKHASIAYFFSDVQFLSKQGLLTINYVDEQGNKISEPTRYQDDIGASYSFGPKEIEGYTFKEVRGETQGTIQNIEQSITFVYSHQIVGPGVNIQDKTSLYVKNTTLFVGEPWNPEDNLISATDSSGNPLSIKDIEVIGQVDTKRVGSYTLIYKFQSIDQNDIETVATVTVLEKENIQQKSSEDPMQTQRNQVTVVQYLMNKSTENQWSLTPFQYNGEGANNLTNITKEKSLNLSSPNFLSHSNNEKPESLPNLSDKVTQSLSLFGFSSLLIGFWLLKIKKW